MLGEPMLRPLLFVILCHVVAFLTPVAVLGLRDRHLAALALLAILLVSSGSALLEDWRRYRRPGPIGGSLLVTWALTAIVAVLAARYGIC